MTGWFALDRKNTIEHDVPVASAVTETCVGAVIAAGVVAHALVGAVGLALMSGGGLDTVVVDIALSFSLYGTLWLAAAVAAVVCWWALGRT